MDSFTQYDGNLLIGIQHALNADWLTPIMKAITLLGEAGIFWIILCLVLIIVKRTRRLGLICAFSLLFTFIICNLIIKPTVDRVRPWVTFEMVNAMMPPPGDASFPSGHSANSMGPAWAFFLATMPVKTGYGRSYDMVRCLGWNGVGAPPRTMHKLSIAAVVLAVFIGISRLYLGMHYPSDVVCGLLIGMIVATVVYAVILKIEDKRGLIGSHLLKDPEKTK